MLQARNESESGHLKRYLENIKKIADEIFIVDDASTDNSLEIYQQYTDKDHILRSEKRNFSNELYLKAALLPIILKSNPDWIVWSDADTILSKDLSDRHLLAEFLEHLNRNDHDGAYLHNLNMWRHPAFYRYDNQFNGLWHMVFWKNTGRLHYNPSPGLHQQQFPHGILKPHGGRDNPNHELLHYGFASKDDIIRKYLTYKSYGQSGWALDRLIDEQSSFVLRKVPKDLFPAENLPDDYDTVEIPNALTYNEIRHFQSYEEYRGKYVAGM